MHVSILVDKNNEKKTNIEIINSRQFGESIRMNDAKSFYDHQPNNRPIALNNICIHIHSHTANNIIMRILN